MKNSLHLFESQVISQARDAIIVVDNDLRVIYLNPAAEQQYEIASQNALGRHLNDLYCYHWESPDQEAAAFSALEKEGAWRGENIHLTQSGKKLYVESNVSELRNKIGEKIGILAVIRDITEQKIQAEIRQAHNEFLHHIGAILSSLSDPEQIMQATGESIGRYLKVSRVFFVEIREAEGLSIVLYDWHEEGMESTVGTYRISDYADESFLQSLLRKENYIMRDTATDLRTSAQRFAALKIGAALNIPYISDCRLKYVLAIGHHTARDWRTDEIDLMTELTTRLWPAIERAQTERALRESEKRFQILAEERDRLLEQEKQARENAEAATRAKDDFLAIISHELRSPLNAILGYNRLMLAKPGDSELIKKSCGVIDRNARIQLRLIEDLLDTARIINGKLHIEPVPIDINLILTDAIAVAQPAAEAKRITLQTRLDSLQNVVLGDRARLQQVIVNLLSNAIKFTPAGGRVEVHTNNRAGKLCIAVQDTGMGIEPQFLPYVFEQYRQADARSSARRQGGLGLGLSLVRRLVEMHGGEITAASDGPGQGAIFTVLLPVGK